MRGFVAVERYLSRLMFWRLEVQVQDTRTGSGLGQRLVCLAVRKGLPDASTI
jgi:hypothetical protein